MQKSAQVVPVVELLLDSDLSKLNAPAYFFVAHCMS